MKGEGAEDDNVNVPFHAELRLYKAICANTIGDQEPEVVSIQLVEPLIIIIKIKDPSRKGHCMLDLSIKDTARSPKNY